MKHLWMVLLFAAAGIASPRPFSGRWDLTVKTPTETYPSWIQFTPALPAPKVRLVGRVASVHPATNVKLEGSKLTFSTMEWFGKEIPVKWEFTINGDQLTGRQMRSDGVMGEITGVPQPLLNRAPPQSWGPPEPLFDGKDLTGWEADNPAENHYVAQNGELVNQKAGANIRTKRKFQDFKLHIEYNCPDGGNSGVYLRGRYEIQVAYEKPGVNDKYHDMGSIYGFLAAAAKVPRKPGQWESFDVILVGRTVTVVRDGITIIKNALIPGITGGALDSHEAEPGPLYIQGDHTGGMKYRNITISEAKR